ncbi:uncharacterized protein LOC142325147 isoform X3 [Lycorma delicatula]|uniref:uncharacterized protein LOC142325147 isoform X3 n=1 Tax=Lycorma delicatula TaxID=130591 RepID=UPI003F510C49
MELPPGQSYGYQRECMTFNYPVKPDPSEKCSEIDENKRKEHTSEDGEVMYVKVDPKCFDGTDDGGVSANHQTTIKHETEPEKVNNYEMEEPGLSSQVTRQDQHSYAKIEILRGKTPTEIHGQLKEVCGNSAVDRSTVSRWAQRLRESCRSVTDDSRTERPKITTENMSADIIATILDEDRRITAEEISVESRYGNHRFSRSSVHRILTDVLGKRKEGLIPQELPTGSCKSPTHSQHPPPQPRPPSSMEPSQSNVAVDKDSDRKLIPQQETEWCQKIDADEIAHFLDVDIAMKESEMKYNTALGTIDQKVLSCLRQKTSPACKENNYSTGEPRRLYTQHAYVQTTNSEKPFTCSVCGKYFNQASHLQQHMRTHTGERPFTCSLCSGTFTRMSDLKRHMRTHTGEKPYKCSVCSNMFGDVSHLKTHMRTHTECPSALLSEVEVEAEVLFCLIRRSIANDIACGNPILLRCLLSICSITNPLTSFCRKSLLLFTLFLFPVFII